MKQTALQWLLENLISEPLAEEHFEHNKECWNKAEEMEKQQIINAWENGYREFYDGSSTPEEYYNKTFKNTNK